MKKAVSSLVAFLKKKKDDFSLLRDFKPAHLNENPVDQAHCENVDRFAVLRPCQRCVLVHEKDDALHSLSRKQSNAIVQITTRNQAGVESTEISLPSNISRKTRLRFFDGICDQYFNSLTLILEHVLRAESLLSLQENIDPHHPVLIWLCSIKKGKDGDKSKIYEDEDLIVVNFLFEETSYSGNLLAQLPACKPASDLMVWLLVNKFPKEEVTLDMEEELIIGYLDDIFDVAFFHITSSAPERLAKIDALFRAVDEILEISAHANMASGDSENALSVKEVIIETATVVTSTAAESTATVGIETAAMALGQAAAGIAISVLVDIALTAGSVTRAKIKRDKGLISNSQFKSTVRRKLCDSGCQFIGGTTGTIVGQVLIPVPVVGALVGGFFGSLIGVGVSKGIIKTSELIAKAQSAKAKAITEV
ncbi:uncharacterized protein [Montipora capricornis]|uniref:uncharacterized protein n=1 Tax=Montipora capricornis TaxID=246305 RepID=UPI0035F21B3B